MDGSTTRRHEQADEHTERCTALTKTGTPCQSYALRDGSGLCVAHSKTREENEQHMRAMRAAKVENELRAAIAEAEADRRRLEAQAAHEQSDDTSEYTSPLPEVFDHEADLDRRLEDLRAQLAEERDEAGDRAWFSPDRLSIHRVPALTPQLVGQSRTTALSPEQVLANRMRVQRAQRGVL